jgi:S1-C subfamily serine protease
MTFVSVIFVPAALAYEKGDIVVKLGDSTVVDMMSYMKVLATFDKGNKTKVVVDRKGELVEAEINF